MKKHKLCISVFLIALIVIASSTGTTETSFSNSFGKSFFGQVTKAKAGGSVAAEVNGEKIYTWEVNYLNLQKKYENVNYVSNKEELIKTIAKQKLIIAEAKRLGLEPSQDEIDLI